MHNSRVYAMTLALLVLSVLLVQPAVCFTEFEDGNEEGNDVADGATTLSSEEDLPEYANTLIVLLKDIAHPMNGTGSVNKLNGTWEKVPIDQIPTIK